MYRGGQAGSAGFAREVGGAPPTTRGERGAFKIMVVTHVLPT